MRWAIGMWIVGVAACGAPVGGEGSGRKAPPPPLVQTWTVKPREVRWTRSYPATLEAGEATRVLARASGHVVAWDVDRGDPVRRGQRMASVEREEASAQQRQAAAQVEAARVVLLQARDQAARLERLAERQFVSAQELDQARTALRVAEAQVQAADAALKTLATRLGWTEVTAPFDGVVIERIVERGTLVGPQGPPLFTVASLSRIRAVTAVPQEDAPWIRLGQEGRLELPGVTAEEGLSGTVARFAPVLDPATRTLAVEWAFDNGDGRLLPGAFGRVTVVLREQRDVMVLPPQSVGRKGSLGIVYRVVAGRAVRTEVSLGSTLPDGSVEVLSGLAPGDQVVVVGRDLVRDGQPVRVVEAPEGGAGR